MSTCLMKQGHHRLRLALADVVHEHGMFSGWAVFDDQLVLVSMRLPSLHIL